MKIPYAPPSPLPVFPSPTTQPHLPLLQSQPFIIPPVSPVSHLLRSHQHGPRITFVRHHKIHQYVLTVLRHINGPPRFHHPGPTFATVLVQILGFQDHELGQHDRVLVRMDGVDPLPPRQVQIVCSREQPDQAVGVRGPDSERELDRLGVHLHVVVAYDHPTCRDERTREEPRVEAVRCLADQRDRCRAGVGDREVVGEFREGSRWSGGVSPEDDHRRYWRGRGVRGSNRAEERDAGLGIAVYQNRNLIRSELSRVRKLGTVAWVVGECTQTQSSEMCIDKEENDGENGSHWSRTQIPASNGLRVWTVSHVRVGEICNYTT